MPGALARGLWGGLLLLLLLGALGALAARNLPYPGVWYDEAWQFWVSRGVSAYADPLTPAGGWRDVMRVNSYGNLDPGGYSLLLHAWMAAGTGVAWLRLSPFLFLVLGAALLARHARELTGSPWAALPAAFLPLAYPAVVAYAFEIRAYAMEVAGVLAAGYLLHRAVRRPGRGAYLGLGAACAAFLWSRYSFAVVVAAALGALVWARRRALARVPAELAWLAWTGVLLAQSGYLLVRVSLGAHLRGSLHAPEYVRRWVLRDQAWPVALETVRENLLSPPALPLTLAVAALALWPRLRRRRALAAWPGARSFPAVAGMALLAQLLSFALAAGGQYPWDLRQKWSLYLHGASMLCALYLGSAAWCLLRAWRGAPVLAAALLLAAGALAARTAAYRRTHWADVAPALAHLERAAVRPGSVLIPAYEVPALRYLYEGGPFRGSPLYPGAFRLVQPPEPAGGVLDARAVCLQWVVTPAPPEKVAPRLLGARLRRVEGPVPPHLLQVEPEDPRADPCAPPPGTPGRGP